MTRAKPIWPSPAYTPKQSEPRIERSTTSRGMPGAQYDWVRNAWIAAMSSLPGSVEMTNAPRRASIGSMDTKTTRFAARRTPFAAAPLILEDVPPMLCVHVHHPYCPRPDAGRRRPRRHTRRRGHDGPEAWSSHHLHRRAPVPAHRERARGAGTGVQRRIGRRPPGRGPPFHDRHRMGDRLFGDLRTVGAAATAGADADWNGARRHRVRLPRLSDDESRGGPPQRRAADARGLPHVRDHPPRPPRRRGAADRPYRALARASSRSRLKTSSRHSVATMPTRIFIKRGTVANRRRIGHLSHSFAPTSRGANSSTRRFTAACRASRSGPSGNARIASMSAITRRDASIRAASSR